MSVLYIFITVLRVFVFGMAMVAGILIMLGPGVCYVIKKNPSTIECDGTASISILDWNTMGYGVYGQIVIFTVPLILSVKPLYYVLYYSLYKVWPCWIQQLITLSYVSIIFAGCGAIEVWMILRYGAIGFWNQMNVTTFIQGWASAGGLYFGCSILLLIDSVVMFCYRTKKQDECTIV
uniref:Transmembrane 9 superfamily member n=1 Tax=Rhabditophanes sp. KR3021 TaxID=114890 RepID=A0AC35U3C6_9BILA